MRNPTTTTEPSGNRKDTLPIKVFCNPAERQAIVDKAGQCGLSASNFLRNVGLGIGIVSAFDRRNVEELARINGDLGRLGGLLKLWLQSDNSMQRGFQLKCHDQLLETLAEIKASQTLLRAVIKQAVKS